MRTWMLALCAAALAGCAGGGALLEEREAEIASLRNRLGTKDAEISQLQQDYSEAVTRAEALEAELRAAAEKDGLDVERTDDCTVLRLPGHILFSSASAYLTDPGQEVVGRLAEILARYPEHEVRVEGHTDSQPVGPETKERYFSNWELSTARASSVVRYMVYGFEVAPERMVAVGYAHYRPVADNASPEGRAINRRVELHVAMRQQVVDAE